MIPVFWFLVLAIFVSPGLGVYHNDIFHRETYKFDGSNDDALFGFSVSSMASGKKSKLLVGAPKQDNMGEVYSCDPTTRACMPVSRADIRGFDEDLRYINHSYWFGATVSGTEDMFVACAPRFIVKKMVKDYPQVGIFGRCYAYDDPAARHTMFYSVPRSLIETKHPFETTMETFGWAVFIDESDDSIYIGGPGMGSGRLMRVRSDRVDTTGYAYGNYSKHNATFNFGYSVTTGQFKKIKLFGKSKVMNTQVAVGSTYGNDGRGKVIFRPYSNISSISSNELVGPTVGAMYGATLCAASFNSDGNRNALLVGAPAFANYDGYNTGAVYVYTEVKRNGFLPTPITMFAGDTPNSFFGSSILNVGDLNGDKYDEIAIAAPYFENTGCVYIYSGAHLAIPGHKPVPIQKILPSPGIRTFGYSLGLLKDYDENGCDELAIGAPESNEVTVMHCIAVITVNLLPLPRVIRKGSGNENKHLQVCFDVQFPDKPKEVHADIEVQIAIDHEGASLQVPANGQLKFLIKKNKSIICENIKLFLNGNGKYNKPILYNMTATHILSKDKDFKPENVNLSVKSELSVTDLMWVHECGNGTCMPRLTMNAIYSDESPYLIGSKPSIETLISVVNTGEVAYDACMHIDVSGADITKLPNNCQVLVSDILECRTRQPMYTNKTWDQDISIDTSALTNENKTISVNMTLFYECGNDSRIVSDEKYFTLNAAGADSFSIQGHTDEGIDNFVNLTRGDIAAQNKFQHNYKITNKGPTNWVNVPINIAVPKLDIAKVAVYVDNEPCSNATESLNETIYNCNVGSIPKDSDKDAQVIFTVVPDKLDAIIGKEDTVVYSKIYVVLNKEEKYLEVKSELMLVEAVIPIWIIIAASILALIILVILFFILRECGCLKRKNKEELKRVRMSVRRQTMMRKSMMGRPPSADQETLVREAEASHESNKKKKDRRVIINDF